MAPLVSLALAVKNGLPHLKSTIDAVRRQTYSNYELVVQDGASTDGSREYLSSLTDMAHLKLVAEPDTGIGQAYNRALARCSGDLVCFLACDEYLEDDALETAVDCFRHHPTAVLVNGAVRLTDSHNHVVQIFESPHFNLLGHLKCEVVLAFAGLLNRHRIGSDMFYDERLKTCPDYDFWIRLGTRFAAADFVVLDKIFKTARADRTSMSYRAESFRQFCRDKRFALNRFLGAQPPGPVVEAVRASATAGILLWAAENVWSLQGASPSFFRWCKEAARLDPFSPRLANLAARSRAFTLDQATGRVRTGPEGHTPAARPAILEKSR